MDTQRTESKPADDELRSPIVEEEESLLRRVNAFLADYRPSKPPPIADYEADMISLRDQIAVARLEDVPALMQQMERIAGIAARRAENVQEAVDPKSPYFGHIRLKEEGKPVRDVLIGKATLIDAKAGVRIVDWRHAPVSSVLACDSARQPALPRTNVPCGAVTRRRSAF